MITIQDLYNIVGNEIAGKAAKGIFKIEERPVLNFFKHNRELMNAGELKDGRYELVLMLLEEVEIINGETSMVYCKWYENAI